MSKSKEDVQELLQKRFEAVGAAVSKENAWKLFKEAIHGIVDLCLEDQDNAVSLSGIGKFEILKVAPRQSKVGVVEYIPRLRFRPSTRINEYLEEKMGQVPDVKKMEAVKAKLMAAGKLRHNLPPRPAKDPAAEEAKPTSAVKPAEKKDAAKKGKKDFSSEF